MAAVAGATCVLAASALAQARTAPRASPRTAAGGTTRHSARPAAGRPRRGSADVSPARLQRLVTNLEGAHGLLYADTLTRIGAVTLPYLIPAYAYDDPFARQLAMEVTEKVITPATATPELLTALAELGCATDNFGTAESKALWTLVKLGPVAAPTLPRVARALADLKVDEGQVKPLFAIIAANGETARPLVNATLLSLFPVTKAGMSGAGGKPTQLNAWGLYADGFRALGAIRSPEAFAFLRQEVLAPHFEQGRDGEVEIASQALTQFGADAVPVADEIVRRGYARDNTTYFRQAAMLYGHGGAAGLPGLTRMLAGCGADDDFCQTQVITNLGLIGAPARPTVPAIRAIQRRAVSGTLQNVVRDALAQIQGAP